MLEEARGPAAATAPVLCPCSHRQSQVAVLESVEELATILILQEEAEEPRLLAVPEVAAAHRHLLPCPFLEKEIH